jgi:hypothetical protein
MQLCADSAIPNVNSMIAQIQPALTFPPTFPTLGSLLPTLPSPMFPSLQIPNLSLMMTAVEMQAFQLQNTLVGMMKPMLDLLSIDINSFLPPIPGLPGYNLLTLISAKADELIATIKASILGGFRFPGLPDPLFPSMTIPDLQVLTTLQVAVSNYMQMIATMLPDLIESVTKKLKIPNITGLPTLPNIDDVSALAVSAYASAGRKLSALSSLSFPGLPALPALPDPLLPSFTMPDIDFASGLMALFNNLTTGLMQPIMEFIENTLSRFLSFSFPKFCITLG